MGFEINLGGIFKKKKTQEQEREEMFQDRVKDMEHRERMLAAEDIAKAKVGREIADIKKGKIVPSQKPKGVMDTLMNMAANEQQSYKDMMGGFGSNQGERPLSQKDKKYGMTHGFDNLAGMSDMSGIGGMSGFGMSAADVIGTPPARKGKGKRSKKSQQKSDMERILYG